MDIVSSAWSLKLACLGAVVAVATSHPARVRDVAPEFADRADPAALDEVIRGLSATAAAAPLDPGPRLKLARAESFWAELHATLPSPEIAAHLSSGAEAAREALGLLSPGYAAAVRQDRPLSEALRAIEPGGAEALYWIAADRHQLAAQRGLAALLLEVEDLQRLFERVIELAPGTFHGGAFLHEAELELAVPAGYASSLQTAAADLAQAARFGSGWLYVDLVWAERWAVKAQDYGLFERKLERVLETPSGFDPDLIPENELAKRRAKALLASAQVLFTRAAIQRGETGPSGKGQTSDAGH